ncbi:hypothetical protein BKA65DRAFT_486065 [Rhexocercosporidium sp. MPI-PUGE-AT-0058]|nr:hypothetical protein BKA65DRAFT_486065 [Rhexocercosporidium sp. MPI-PUGE-AT-0058]
MAARQDLSVYIHPSRIANITEALPKKDLTVFAHNQGPQSHHQRSNKDITQTIIKILDDHNPTPLGDQSTIRAPIKLPRRHGKRRRAPDGQYIKPQTTYKSPPNISKNTQRLHEKMGSRIWRDHTRMPKRVKTTMSNEERSTAMKARKAENKRKREEETARKDKVLQDLKGMVHQAEDARMMEDKEVRRKTKVLEDLQDLSYETKHV